MDVSLQEIEINAFESQLQCQKQILLVHRTQFPDKLIGDVSTLLHCRRYIFILALMATHSVLATAS